MSLPSDVEEAIWQGAVIARKLRRGLGLQLTGQWQERKSRSFNQWQRANLIVIWHPDHIVRERTKATVRAIGAISDVADPDGDFVCIQKP